MEDESDFFDFGASAIPQGLTEGIAAGQRGDYATALRLVLAMTMLRDCVTRLQKK